MSDHRSRQAGQVLPLTAFFIVVLLGASALVLDVARVYSSLRFERSVADAAALAGAQDLQTPGSRVAVTTAQQQQGRADALRLLARELGAASAPSCSTNSNITGCAIPGTSYTVSIKTPSPTAASVDPSRSVLVTISQSVSLTFSRIPPFSQANWNPTVTSVAGISFGAKYAVVTLQPPNPRNDGTDSNLLKDLVVNGNNTVLNVTRGDVGTNTSASTTNQGLITLGAGYALEHYDDTSLQAGGVTWTVDVNGNPKGRKINSLIHDPAYSYPTFVGEPFTSEAEGAVPCSGANYPTDWTSVLPSASTTCYQPGVYDLGSQPFTIGTGNTGYLMPGAYYFKSGLRVRGSLAGGLISNQQGVVIELPRTQVLDANNALNLLLNVGGESCNSDTCRATPATDFTSPSPKQVKTPAGFVLSIMVERDHSCFSGTTPIESASCNINQNKTVQLAGSGLLRVAGVVYGPSDNMTINGGSSQAGLVGQLFSWTVTYTGGSTLNQEYPGRTDNGVLRLDTGCSGPGSACTP